MLANPVVAYPVICWPVRPVLRQGGRHLLGTSGAPPPTSSSLSAPL